MTFGGDGTGPMRSSHLDDEECRQFGRARQLHQIEGGYLRRFCALAADSRKYRPDIITAYRPHARFAGGDVLDPSITIDPFFTMATSDSRDEFIAGDIASLLNEIGTPGNGPTDWLYSARIAMPIKLGKSNSASATRAFSPVTRTQFQFRASQARTV